MTYRIVGALSVLLSCCAATDAQITPVSGGRGVSVSATGAPTQSAFAGHDVPVFNTSRSNGSGGGNGSASIQSNLTPSQWTISGSAMANAMFASAGTSITANSTAYLTFEVAPGTELHVSYYCQGTYGGFNSRVSVQGAGLNVFAMGGQLGMGGSRTVQVMEQATVYLDAQGGGTSYSGGQAVFGNYSITITATPIPSPSAAWLLALAGSATVLRRRSRA